MRWYSPSTDDWASKNFSSFMQYRMTLLLILLVISVHNVSYGQRSADIHTIQQQTEFKKNKIYLFCRGTKSKSAQIAHEFNTTDTNSTHTGIGFYKNGHLFIYHVTDVGGMGRSALLIDSLSSFIEASDVYYLAVWECASTVKEIAALEKICANYYSRKIFFDAEFNIGDNDSLYCSEFCALVLRKLDSAKFNFQPRTITLHNILYQQILGRKQLTYYPVDFFWQNKYFTKTFSYRIVR